MFYLDGLAVSPENVKGWLEEKHEQANDPWYDLRYKLKTEKAEYEIDAHGLIRDHGSFAWGQHWIVAEAYYTSLDGCSTDIAIDENGYEIHCFDLEPWEQDYLGCKTIGVYRNNDGLLGHYYHDSMDASELVEDLDVTEDYDPELDDYL